MSGPDTPQRRDAEIRIEIGAAPDHDAAPEPPQRSRIPNAALAYAAIIIALAAGVIAIVKAAPGHRPLAEATVVSFLEEVREGDVEGALAHTDMPDASGEFLVPEALDRRWSVVTVAQTGYEPLEAGGAVADVYAEIEAFDGTRLATHFPVVIEDGQARIREALSSSDSYPALGYLELNGVRSDSDTEFMQVLLLPGIYTAYKSLPDTLKLDRGPSLALGDTYRELGGAYTDEWLAIPMPQVSETGVEAMAGALRDFFDACAENPDGDGCPFAFPVDDERDLALAPGASWEVAVYPRALPNPWIEIPLGFRLHTAEPGEARVRATVTEADGQTRETTLSCAIWVEGMYVKFDDAGDATIDPRSSAYERCSAMLEVG